MAKKPKPILLWDIVPGKWYLHGNPKYGGLQNLVQVHCDPTTTGWERGHVIITDRHWHRAKAAVTTINKSVLWLDVQIPYNDYRFNFSSGSWCTLFNVPAGFIEEKTAAYEAEMKAVTDKYNKIKGMLDANALR